MVSADDFEPFQSIVSEAVSYSVSVQIIPRWDSQEAGNHIGHYLSGLTVVSYSKSDGYLLWQVHCLNPVRRCGRTEYGTENR